MIILKKEDKMQAKSDLKDSKFSAMEPITEAQVEKGEVKKDFHAVVVFLKNGDFSKPTDTVEKLTAAYSRHPVKVVVAKDGETSKLLAASGWRSFTED